MKNVLLICADMIAARHLGCYGDPAKLTPNIDRLAASGIRFDQAYCATTPCIPARVTMMTGLYAHTHGKTAHIKMPLMPARPLLPEILSRHGYKTALVGKTHWWPPTDTLGCDEAYITIDTHLTPELGSSDAWIQYLEQRGLFQFNEATWEEDKQHLQPDQLPENALKVNWTGDVACTLLRELHNANQPFFLYCSFVEPHGPGSVKTEFLKTLDNVPLRKIINPSGSQGDKPATQQQAVAQWSQHSINQREHYRRGVYASLQLVDQNIGKLLDTLDTLDLWPTTTVILLTDHGDLMFDHGCIEKTYLYESSVHIPFIMAGPGIPAAQQREQLISQVDLLPTVLDLCDIQEADLRGEGRSICPLIADSQSPWREMLFCEVEQSIHLKGMVQSSIAKMIRTGEWKYIYTLVDGKLVEEELYNLDIDPDELINMAHHPDQQNRIQGLRQEILNWLIRTEVNRLHPVADNHYPVPHTNLPFE